MSLKQFKPSNNKLFYVPLTPAKEETDVSSLKSMPIHEFLEMINNNRKKLKRKQKTKQPKGSQ